VLNQSCETHRRLEHSLILLMMISKVPPIVLERSLLILQAASSLLLSNERFDVIIWSVAPQGSSVAFIWLSLDILEVASSATAASSLLLLLAGDGSKSGFRSGVGSNFDFDQRESISLVISAPPRLAP